MKLAESKAKGKLWHIIYRNGRWIAISHFRIGPNGFPIGVVRRNLTDLINRITK